MLSQAKPSAFQVRMGLGLLAAIMLLNQMDRFVLSVLAQPIIKDLHLTDTQFGLLTGLAFAIFYGLCGLPLARLADRGHRPNLLAICLVVWTLATTVSGMVINFGQLLAARIVMAAGEAGTQPAAHTLIADYVPPERRTSAFAIVAAGGSLGGMLALVLGGLLEHLVGWRWTIILFGLVGIPVALATRLWLFEPRGGGRSIAPPKESLWGAGVVLLRSRVYRWQVASVVFCLLPIYAVAAWAPAFFARSHGLSVRQVGLWLGLITGLASFAGQALTSYLTHRAQRGGPGAIMIVPMVSIALSGPAFALSFLSPTPILAFCLYVLPQMLGIMWYSPVFASIQTTTPSHLRAQAAALTLLFGNLFAIAVGPTVSGILSDLLKPHFGVESLRYALLAVANLSILGAVASFMAGRAMRDAASDSSQTREAI